MASKLTEEFYRPAVVVSQGKEWSKASARSIEEFNIVEAVRTFAELLGDHGGHPRAAGFSVETKKIIFLKKRLQELAEKQLDKESLKPTLRVDAEVELSDLNFELYQQLEKFAPFGMDNPQPVFATSGVRVVEAQTVGRQSRHLSLRLSTADHQFPIRAIGFGLGGLYPQLSPDREIDIAYNLLLDEWNGEKRLQLKLKDIKLASH